LFAGGSSTTVVSATSNTASVDRPNVTFFDVDEEQSRARYLTDRFSLLLSVLRWRSDQLEVELLIEEVRNKHSKIDNCARRQT
jgi:hypothetical protein